MIKSVLSSLVLLMCTPAVAVEIYFSPGRACENQIVRAINDSKSNMVVAVYSINNPRIVDALKSAHSRGVKMRILTDRVQAAGRSSRVLELVSAGLDIRVHSKHKIEHNKFGVTQLRRPKGRGLWGPSSGYSLRLRFGNSSAWTGPSSALSSCV